MHRITRLIFAMTLLPVGATLAAHAQDEPTAYMVTYVEVLPAATGKAIALIRELADVSRKHTGAVRIDVLQRLAPTNQFLLLEVWKDQPSLDLHVGTNTTKQVRDKLQPLLLAPIDDRVSLATSVGPLPAGNARGTVYVATHVDVSPATREKGIGLLRPFAEAGRKDAGNLRFDVLQQKARTNHFTVVEIWKDQKSDDAHELAAHTKELRDQIQPLIGALYDQRWYKSL